MVIVLTKVNIRSSNPAGETDQSDDDDTEDELRQFYIPDSQLSDIESDIEDFIDDRPEEDLSEHSGASEDEELEEEGIEYDSDRGSENNGSEDESESVNNETNQNETENDNEIKPNSSNDNDDDDDEDEVITSPRKKAKLNVLRDDDTSESSSDEASRISLSSDDETTHSQPGSPIPSHVAAATKEHTDENKFGVYLLPKIDSV